MSFDRAALKRDLRTAESRRRVVYDDANGSDIGPGSLVVGHPTIGCGKRLDLPLSDKAIDFLLDESIDDCIAQLDIGLGWWRELPEPQQRCVIELVFSMGIQGLLRFHRLLPALKSGDYERAAIELGDSRWARQVKATRTTRLQNLLRGTLNAD